MSAKPVQLYSGVDSVRAANELHRAIQARRDDWPYVHVYPPFNADDVHVISTAAVVQASTVEVLNYTVNAGKRFYLRAVLFSVPGQNFSPGDATFTLNRNSPAVNDVQFQPEHGLINVPVPLGSSTVQPWPLQRAREFSPNDVIRITATAVSLQGGAYVCGIFGYEVPTLDVKVRK